MMRSSAAAFCSGPRFPGRFPVGISSRAFYTSRFYSQQNETSTHQNFDPAEIQHFNHLSADWWNPTGTAQFLHWMNPIRTQFLHELLQVHLESERKQTSTTQWLRGWRVLDVGCGAGILSESLARLGAQVLAVDAAQENIEMAKRHYQQDVALLHPNSIVYRNCTVETLLESERESFDLVCTMELLEHVPAPRQLISDCCQLLRPGGFWIGSTINRNVRALIETIIIAENLLGLVPPQTHDYQKYLTPDELERWLVENQMDVLDKRGLSLSLLSRRWSFTSDLSVNYMMGARKTDQPASSLSSNEAVKN